MKSDRQFPVKFLIFGASLRQDSLNNRLAALAARAAAQRGAEVDLAVMGDFDCPSYDGDVETSDGLPPGAHALRQRLLAADAFIIAAPEYNGAMLGLLKNAIDWVSRFRPQPWKGRHGLLMSASPSMVGGNRGLWSLRVPLEHLGARVYPDMFSLAQAHQAFSADGGLTDAKLQERFDSTIGCFHELVEATLHYPAVRTQWIEFLGERTTAETDREEAA